MSVRELEEAIRSIVREIVREELSEAVGRNPTPLLTAEQAGEILGLDKQSVYRLVREQALNPIYVSQKHFRLSPEEIERFIREGGVRQT